MKSSARVPLALRIAHLDTGRSWRGGQAQVWMLMQGLAHRGHSCTLLAPRGPLLERARAGGIAAHAWRARNDWDLPALLRAALALRRLAPDVVHCHDARAHALGAPAARLAGVSAVVVARRVAVRPHGGVGMIKYRLGVDRFLCVSRSVMETLRAAGIPAARLAWVPSGALPGSSAPAADLRALIGARPDAPLVGTAAALTAEKSHEVLLRAATRVIAAVPGAHLVWLGEGPRRAPLERLRDALGLAGRVHLLGFRADARALMAQCTVAALVSSSEGFATSLLEAQADGVPAVATRVGGVPEVVRDELTGRLVPPGDADAVAEALIVALSDPELRATWSRNARTAALEFHMDKTVERTIEEYRHVLCGPPPGGMESAC